MSDFVTSGAGFGVLGILLPLLSLICLWWLRGRRRRSRSTYTQWQGRCRNDRW